MKGQRIDNLLDRHRRDNDHLGHDRWKHLDPDHADRSLPVRNSDDHARQRAAEAEEEERSRSPTWRRNDSLCVGEEEKKTTTAKAVQNSASREQDGKRHVGRKATSVRRHRLAGALNGTKKKTLYSREKVSSASHGGPWGMRWSFLER